MTDYDGVIIKRVARRQMLCVSIFASLRGITRLGRTLQAVNLSITYVRLLEGNKPTMKSGKPASTEILTKQKLASISKRSSVAIFGGVYHPPIF